jgi:hypothetical protein
MRVFWKFQPYVCTQKYRKSLHPHPSRDRDTPTATQGFNFFVLSEGPPHSVAFYDTQGDLGDVFLPAGSSRVQNRRGFYIPILIICCMETPF